MSTLLGKVIVQSDLKLVTGTCIGSSQGGLKIGGVDRNVITDPLGRPYIPGSSLKGKLRSLTEYLDQRITFSDKGTHSCQKEADYAQCSVCRIYGTLQTFTDKPTLTRLIVRDAFLLPESITEEMRANIDLDYSELKFETAINRVTGTVLGPALRQIERVPAGAVFRPVEFVFNVYEESDKDLLKYLFEAMALLEDDYLGGMGSRGYGKVKLENIGVWWNRNSDYEQGKLQLLEDRRINDNLRTPSELVQNFATIRGRLT